jgi:hypothetical protein
MNVTEAAYAEILQDRKLAGEIVEWMFEPIAFRLTGDRCTFTPDFGVMLPDGTMEFIDVKGAGPIDDKSIVKIKVAAEKFWMFKFRQEKRQTKKDGGGWVCTEF